LSIDAALARGFGKQAIGEVDRAGGRLRSAAIGGHGGPGALASATATSHRPDIFCCPTDNLYSFYF